MTGVFPAARRPRARAIVILGAIVLPFGCGQDAPRPAPAAQNAPLAGGAVVRVGDMLIPGTLVASIMAAQGMASKDAAEAAVDDALAARGAEIRGLQHDPSVRLRIVAAQARGTLAHLRREAEGLGPPTAEELRVVADAHWREVAMPEQRLVVHALVLRPKHPPPSAASDEEGLAIARRIGAAVTNAATVEDFEQAAKAVDHGSREVHVEALPPFVSDGRITAPEVNGNMELPFAAGAFAIPAEGGVSPPVETGYGLHIIKLLRRLPEHRAPAEELRRKFADELFTRRMRKAVEQFTATLRSHRAVEVAPAAEAILATDLPTPPSGP